MGRTSSTDARRRRGAARASRGARPAGTATAPAGRPLEAWRAALPMAWGILLLAAPAASNLFWGVDAVRSLPLAAALALIACALLAAGLPRVGSARIAIGAGVAVMAVLAFGLAEAAHWLGDTGVRLGALTMSVHGVDRQPWTEWAARVHASPLDFVVNMLLPAALARGGMTVERAVSLVTFATGLSYLAGAVRVVRRMHVPAGLLPAATAALVMAGTLELFAGYAESGGLLLACAAWWWSELLPPLASRRQALRLAGMWLLLFLAHRIAWLMLLPMAWRCLGPAVAGDRPEHRRACLGLTALVALVAAVLAAAGGAGRLGGDFADVFSGGARLPAVAPWFDAVNLLLLVAPLLVLGTWFAARRPASAPPAMQPGLLWIAALPLVPLAFVLPAAPSGLGMQRDWDLATLLGWTLSLAGLSLLVRRGGAALERALTWSLPVLALTAFGWVAVHADAAVTLRRAQAFVGARPLPADPQLGHAQLYLGRWWESVGDRWRAARAYADGYQRVPTPNRGMLAARMYAEARRFAEARGMIARIRARGGLDSLTVAVLDGLEAQIDALDPAGDAAVP